MAGARAEAQIQFAVRTFLLEVVFLFAASSCAIGYRGHLLEDSFRPFVLIALMALAMGTRSAAVGKLASPDLTTTVLRLTITGIAADSSLANGNNPRLARRVTSVVAMFLGAALGAVIIHHSISAALWLGTAISALCRAALFRSFRTSGRLCLRVGALTRQVNRLPPPLTISHPTTRIRSVQHLQYCTPPPPSTDTPLA